MTKPMRLAEFQILPPRVRGHVSDGLAVAIDRVATSAAASHRFLRFGWYAAALEAYGRGYAPAATRVSPAAALHPEGPRRTWESRG